MEIFLEIHRYREAMLRANLPPQVVERFAYVIPSYDMACRIYGDIQRNLGPAHPSLPGYVTRKYLDWLLDPAPGGGVPTVTLSVPHHVPSPPTHGEWFRYLGVPVLVKKT